MLNRRYLRVKVLQALYAWSMDEDADRNRAEHELFKNIEKIYDLYLYMLSLLVELRNTAQKRIKQGQNKNLPTQEDLDPNLKFVNNRVLNLIGESPQLQILCEKQGISWKGEEELVARVGRVIKESDEYDRYMNGPGDDFKHDKDFIADIYRNYITEFELLEDHFSEQNIYWLDDLFLVNINMVKTIQGMKEESSGAKNFMLKLYKDEKDDKKFVKELFLKTIEHKDDYEKMIGERTKNWDVDRIAVMDILLMKMAVCEFEHLETVPVKVSLNEYIELSKNYSTPKSKLFINGVLDKLVADLKRDKRINKKGRGLIE